MEKKILFWQKIFWFFSILIISFLISFEFSKGESFNFSLSNEGNKIVVQQSSVTNLITVILIEGTSQPISFSVSGLPPGAGASFSSISCNPNCSTLLTINTTSLTPIGTYTIKVTGSGGGVTKSTSFNLTVNPLPFDFSIILTPSSKEIYQGEKVEVVLTIDLISGESNKITFTIPKLPPAIRASFSPGSCYPPCVTTLKISTEKEVLEGHYQIQIVTTGGGKTKTTNFYLSILSLPAFDFSLELSHSSEEIWPKEKALILINLKLISGTPEEVSFKSSILPKEIKIYFSPSSCTPPCTSSVEISTSKATPSDIYNFTIFGVAKEIIKKADFKLTVLSTLSSPRLYSPPKNSRITTLNPVLSWTSVFGAKFYLVEINSFKIKAKSSSLTVPVGILEYFKTYNWRVRACEDEELLNCSQWSDTFQFKTITPARLAREKREAKIKEIKKKIAAIMKQIAFLQEELRKKLEEEKTR